MQVASIARRAISGVDGGPLKLPASIRFWDGSVLEGAANGGQPVVLVRDRRALAHMLHAPGQLGLARAWVDGSLALEGDPEAVLARRKDFDGVDLSARDRLRLAVAAVRAAGPGVLRRPPIPAIEASVTGERHSVDRDRATVRHHYDVSNEFYEIVLGPSMTYSCAYFTAPEDSLEQAQERKLDLICRKLRLGRGDRLLDIGCGWGSLILHAATRYGARALGITLSEPQASWGRERVREAGLADLVEIRVADYRELGEEQFDKIASVGMYEHVGREQLGEYVGTARRLLRPGGLFLNHGIARLDSEPPLGPFISRYVFPDGDLRPVNDLISEMRDGGLEVRDVESLREHYPMTLRRWVKNLLRREREAVALVGEERVRAWRLYMLGSALAFEDGDITVYQVLAARHDGNHGLPLNRSELIRPTGRIR